MTFKDAIKKHQGLKILADKLNICSSLGRQRLFDTTFSTEEQWINRQLSLTSIVQTYLCEDINRKNLIKLRANLRELHDIGGTINLLQAKEVLDDVSLYEIKVFSIRCKKIKNLIFDLPSEDLTLPDLNEVIKILDPEGIEAQQFYIYSSYDFNLIELRKRLSQTTKENDHTAFEEIYSQCMEIENEVRQKLSADLMPYINVLQKAMQIAADLDIVFAKAVLNTEWRLTKPIISNKAATAYNGLSYPPITEILESKGKKFQPIDISIGEKPVLITGANMAGKTMLLKSLSFAQYSLQFGFFVAAKSASVCLVADIMTSIGDLQNEEEGLSSFASEILHINSIISKAKTGNRYLILIDELARTTNPYEGKAIVEGFIKVINRQNSLCVITTHYSIPPNDCLKLRVKGFISQNIVPPIAIKDINDHIDYSLAEDAETDVPHEAINLAKLLEIDSEWLSECINEE